MIVWATTSRVISGPISHTSNINMETCKDDWVWTLFMMGNVGVDLMAPFIGCY